MEPKVVLPPSRYGIILPGAKDSPGGNNEEFPEIREGLRKRGITWYEREIPVQEPTGTIFWLYGSEVHKLPEDPEGVSEDNAYMNYIGDEDSGHGISKLDSFLDHHSGEDRCCPK